MKYLNQIVCGDALDLMPDIPSQSVLVLADPPYSIGESMKASKVRGTAVRQKSGNILYVPENDYEYEEWDKERWSAEYFYEMFRVGRNQIIFGGNYYSDILPVSPGWVVWDKCNGSSDYSDVELIWTSFQRGARLFRYMWNGMMQGKSIEEGYIPQGNKRLNEKRFVPGQKPVNLIIWFLLNYAWEGDIVLDPCCGSGTTAEACIRTGHPFICFEKSEKRVEIARERIRPWLEQMRLPV